jgi:peptide/nickel transport system substrate-binding protein
VTEDRRLTPINVSTGLTRRAFLALGGGSVLVLAACGGSSTPSTKSSGSATGSASGSSTPTKGAAATTLTFAIPSYPGSWDQDFIGFDPVALALFKNVMLYMTDYSVTSAAGGAIQNTSSIGPSFAESFSADSTGKVWTLVMRKGLTFPSGNPVTAADVKWSKDRAFAAQANVAGIYRLIGLTTPDQVTVVDDYTVRFDQAYASALSPQIQAICLYLFDSVEAKKHVTAADPWAKTWIGQNPQDGGYYNVTSSVQNQQIVLTANSQSPSTDAPQVTTIRMPVVSSAANLRLQLQNGDVDVAMGLSRRDIQDLKKQSGIDVISSPNNDLVTIEMSVVTEPFTDVRVRQAFAYAMPYDQIIKDVYDGDARPVSSPVPLEMPGYVNTGYPYTYDVDKAKALLQQAGKTSLSTELAYASGDDEQQQLAVLVASSLKAIGVTVKLSPLDPATFADRREKKNIPFQIADGQQWVNDVEYLLSTSLTKQAYLNYSNYSNPQIEAIFAQSHTMTDPDARNALWKQVQQILAVDVPWLVICQPNFNLPVRKGISGWVEPVDGLFRLRYLTKS